MSTPKLLLTIPQGVAAVYEFALDSQRLVLPGRRHGLSNMQSRAQAMGGKLSIQSAPGAGSTVKLQVPLPAIPDGNAKC